MKTSREFFEKLQNDEAFAKEVTEKVKAKADAGDVDYKSVWIPIAEEYGYEVKEAELEEVYEKAAAEMSDEDLGKVAGGTTPTPLIMAATILGTASGAVTGYVSYHTAKDKK